MTQAIRIEHEDGYGIFVSWDINNNYRNHSVNKLINNIRLKHKLFNTPKEDGIAMHMNLFCAYHSIIQLQQFISKKQIQQILSLNYKIYILELSKCQLGKDNIVFNKKDIINKIDITKLFKY